MLWTPINKFAAAKINHLKFFIESTPNHINPRWEDLFKTDGNKNKTVEPPLMIFLKFYPLTISKSDIEWLIDWACGDLNYMRGLLKEAFKEYDFSLTKLRYRGAPYRQECISKANAITEKAIPILKFSKAYKEYNLPHEKCEAAWKDMSHRDAISSFMVHTKEDLDKVMASENKKSKTRIMI